MKLAGEYVFEAEIQEVWDALFDPAVLAAVMPGCEKLDLVDGAYVGEIKVKVGPIQGKFAGKVDLVDQVPPTSYKMIVDGKGAQGFVKATATIKLEAQGTSTRITYDSDAQVGGKIATVGQRLVETSARAIVKQSLEGLAENVLIRSGAHRRAKAQAEAAAGSEVAPVESTPRAEEPAASTDIPAAVVVEPIAYKQADASKLAGAVAKEVGKTYAPIIGVVLIALAVVIYLIAR
jgi:hypothetical protein